MLAWKLRGRKYQNKTSEWKQKVSVALLASRDDNCLRRGSKDETIADSREGESERKLCRKGAVNVEGYVMCQESC